MTHLIDCHVLTMPTDNVSWSLQLRSDLDTEPVNQHWLAGIPGEFGQARAAGFERGAAPFVSFADPDDRIVGGTFAALLEALQRNPGAPFAWAGEQRVDAQLQPLGEPIVWPDGYDQRRHRNRLQGYCHGVVLMRRELCAQALPLLRQCGNGADGVLMSHLARPHAPLSADEYPVHVPIVGRLWRQHPGGYHHQYTQAEHARHQRLAGVTPQYLRITTPEIYRP